MKRNFVLLHWHTQKHTLYTTHHTQQHVRTKARIGQTKLTYRQYARVARTALMTTKSSCVVTLVHLKTSPKKKNLTKIFLPINWSCLWINFFSVHFHMSQWTQSTKFQPSGFCLLDKQKKFLWLPMNSFCTKKEKV